MKEALPYYRWHWRDYRADRKVQKMDYVERGLYRELLDECWAEGFIPDDPEALAEICGCPRQVLDNAWQKLSKCFVRVSEGMLMNNRLNEERTEKDLTRSKRAASGALGGKSKALASKSHIALAEALAKQEQEQSTEDFLKAKNRLIEEMATISRQEMNTVAEKSYDSIWAKIGELEVDHGRSAVVLAFRGWTRDNKNSETTSPVADFYFARDSYLDPDTRQSSQNATGAITKAGTGETDDLCQLMHESGHQSFTGKFRRAVAELLTEFPAGEILSAWNEYIAPMDDNDLRFAPKKFCEGAARDTILTRRKETTKRAAQDTLQAQLLQQEQQKAETELAELKRAQEMEIEEPLS